MSFPEYTLLRSSRKTIALEITADAKLLIRAPQWARVHIPIEHLLVEKEAWIRKRLSEANARLQKAPKRLSNQEIPFCFWAKRKVSFLSPEHKTISRKGMVFLGEENNPKLVLEQWYRAQAKTILPKKLLTTQTKLEKHHALFVLPERKNAGDRVLLRAISIFPGDSLWHQNG